MTVSFIEVRRCAFDKLYIGNEPGQFFDCFYLYSMTCNDNGIYYHVEHLAWHTQRRSEIFGATGTLLLSFRLAEACARIQRLHQVAWLGRE